jgi:hypothetical protein
MDRTILVWLYGLTMRLDWVPYIVAPILFRWYCPRPVLDDWTARACVRAGVCGCNNQDRMGDRANG